MTGALAAAIFLLAGGVAMTFWALQGKLMDNAGYANGGFGIGMFCSGVIVLLFTLIIH